MYKKTLNIFESNFKLRANLKENELISKKRWKDINLLKLVNENKEKEFIFHSGPPYANGNIHIGHALNKIIKDFCFRFHSLNGYSVEYIPGWDTHGLPIAATVIKNNPNLKGKEKTHIFREICLKYANLQIQKQLLQFERLNLLIDFEKKYTTSDKEYVSKQLYILYKLVLKDLIYRKFRPIYWSWSSETALAETEIIYKDKISKSIFIKFRVLNSIINELKDANFLVWTTTPWTIPENKFLTVSSSEEYVLIEFEKEKYICSLNYKNNNEKFKNLKIIKKLNGSEIIGTEYQHPFLNLKSKVYDSEFIEINEGTGIVHNAPAFGIEDFEIAKKINIKIECPINSKGFFNEKSTDKELIGKFYEDTEEIVIEKIKLNNKLFEFSHIKHSYPYDWRTKKPVIFRITKQWYLDIKKNIDNAKNIISSINWIPSWGKKRMKESIENREEWCISRQRSWGTPIPYFINEKNEAILKPELILQVVKLIERDGDQFWWTKDLDQILTKEQINKYKIISKGTDTLDVWFDSGCSSNIIYPNRKIDFICEGNDQFRGWFNSTILINSALNNTNTHKNIMVHGFVNDENGNKMSKSLGNVIDPNNICKTYGADVLRLWIASSNFFNDINIGNKLLEKISKDYIKFRNTIRFLLNNLVDFDPEKDIVSLDELETIDKLILFRLENIISDTTKEFFKQKFYISWKKIFFFLVFDLSNNYLDFTKKILYFRKPNFNRRRKVQTVFYIILKNILILLAPILPHTTDEAYLKMNLFAKNKSIHLEKWPFSNILSNINFEEIKNNILNFKILNDIKINLNQIAEKMIKNHEIKNIEELKVSILIKKTYKPFKKEKDIKLYKEYYGIKFERDEKYNIDYNFLNNKDIKKWLKVNDIKFINKLEDNMYEKNNFLIKIKKITGEKCERCRSLSENLKNKLCSECQKDIS